MTADPESDIVTPTAPAEPPPLAILSALVARPVRIARRLVSILLPAMLVAVLLTYLIVPLPWLKTRLGFALDPGEREWCEYIALVSEILLVVLFGEAVFARQLAESVRSRCERLEAENAVAWHHDGTLIGSAFAALADFAGKTRAGTRWSDIRAVAANVWTLYRYVKSTAFLNRVALLVLSRLVPGGLYSAFAMIVALIHFGCEIVLLQDVRHALP